MTKLDIFENLVEPIKRQLSEESYNFLISRFNIFLDQTMENQGIQNPDNKEKMPRTKICNFHQDKCYNPECIYRLCCMEWIKAAQAFDKAVKKITVPEPTIKVSAVEDLIRELDAMKKEDGNYAFHFLWGYETALQDSITKLKALIGK